MLTKWGNALKTIRFIQRHRRPLTVASFEPQYREAKSSRVPLQTVKYRCGKPSTAMVMEDKHSPYFGDLVVDRAQRATRYGLATDEANDIDTSVRSWRIGWPSRVRLFRIQLTRLNRRLLQQGKGCMPLRVDLLD